MPEGPEIKRSADTIAAAIENQDLKEVIIEWPPLVAWQNELAASRILKVEAKSKAMLIHFDNHMTLYSHNQLYGVWYVRKNGNRPKTNRSLRLGLKGPQKTAWLYSATDIALLDPDELASHPYLSKLGPDVLDGDITEQEILKRYKNPAFQRRKLTTLLLDQGFLAGLGNYLRSEILFWAKVPISARPCDCTPQQLKALAKASLLLPRRSYKTGGITLDEERSNALKKSGASRNQYRFYVFAKAGQGCESCQSPIVKEQAGGRRIYFCPKCQK